jgi:hypothetical protein
MSPRRWSAVTTGIACGRSSSGTSGETQVITHDNATVTTEEPLVIDTTGTGGDAISITGDGALSFSDPQSSNTMLRAPRLGLNVRSNGDSGDSAASVTIDTAATITSEATAIVALNYGSGATSVTASGDLTSTTRFGIGAVNATSGTDLTVTTGVGSSVRAAYGGIDARNLGVGATTIIVNGDLTSAQKTGLNAYNGASATDLTVATGVDSSVSAYATYMDAISVYNTGSGATTVNANGTVTSAAGKGIYAHNRLIEPASP